jgi:hypothetical protein
MLRLQSDDETLLADACGAVEAETTKISVVQSALREVIEAQEWRFAALFLRSTS